MSAPRDPTGSYDVSPEAVGQDRATREHEPTGPIKFVGVQLWMWLAVVVVLAVGIVTVVVYASGN